ETGSRRPVRAPRHLDAQTKGWLSLGIRRGLYPPPPELKPGRRKRGARGKPPSGQRRDLPPDGRGLLQRLAKGWPDTRREVSWSWPAPWPSPARPSRWRDERRSSRRDP